MKIRKGFVSNSSSSSFIVCFEGNAKTAMNNIISEDDATDCLVKYFQESGSEEWWYDEFYENYSSGTDKHKIIEFMLNCCSFVYYEKKDLSIGTVQIGYSGDCEGYEDYMMDWFKNTIFKDNFIYHTDM